MTKTKSASKGRSITISFLDDLVTGTEYTLVRAAVPVKPAPKTVRTKASDMRIKSARSYSSLSSALAKHYRAKNGKDPSKQLYMDEAKLVSSAVGCHDWDEASDVQLRCRTRVEIALAMCHDKRMGRAQRATVASAVAHCSPEMATIISASLGEDIDF